MLDLVQIDPPAGFLCLPLILNAAHNGVMVINREGTVVFYNQGAARVFGEDPETIIGKHFSEVRPEAWDDLKKVLDTGIPQIGRKIVLPKATIIVNRSPVIEEDRVVGAVSVFQDISEYEAIISKLQGYQRLHRELEAIFESSDDGLYITDRKANTVRVNSAYERITGLSRDQLIGRNMRTLVKEGYFDYSVSLEVLKKKAQITLMQHVKGDKQVMVTGTPIFDEQGEVVLVVTNVRDITELNELRAQLEESRRLSSRYYQSMLEQESFDHTLRDLVVKSRPMMQVVERAIKAAESDASVLIHGESGTGKSMLARLIHEKSPRKNAPFVKINCGAIPESLMESELFGYEKGAFTGASTSGKAGLLEAGHSGTVFLDEIGELKSDLQVKLLEVIEDRSFTRVGGTRSLSVDIRIIAATNRDLKEMMSRKQFREDLFYRLNVIPIEIPPLRRRGEDIPALALNYLARFNRKANTSVRLTPEVLDRLGKYPFPGNVRELLNILERMTVMCHGDQITLMDLPAELREPARDPGILQEGIPLKEAVESLEASIITQALRQHETEAAAATALGIHPTTLWRKAVKYGIKLPIAKPQ